MDTAERLEDDRRKSFRMLVDELQKSGSMVEEDANAAKQFYESVRIPIHHAIVARYARARGQTGWTELVRSDLVMNDFESAVETSAVPEIERAVELLAKYRT